jgi:hypothetical protein
VSGRKAKAPTTVYLGRYTWEHANAIAEQLEKAEIVWWYKQPGIFSEVWEFGGIRLFVDRDRVVEARAIADAIAPDGTHRPRGSGPGA